MHRFAALAVFTACLAFHPIDSAYAATEEEDSEEDSSTKKKGDKKDPANEDIDLDMFKETETEDPMEAQPTKRLDESDKIESADPQETEDDTYKEEQKGPEFDFDEDESSVPIGGPGQDTAKIYRDYKSKVEHIGPDEEVISWEQYLAQYPKSLFKSQIQARIDDLQAGLFEESVPGGKGFGDLDAGRREIDIANPLLIEPIDPRTRISGGFEIGFPEYKNIMVDYEHQFLRELSGHVGVRQRYSGMNVETGARWAFVKSARTKTIVSLIGDIHANTQPFYPGFRPQIGFGKRFGSEQKLDAQAQVGVDLLLQSPASVVTIGGGNLTYHASNKVSFFLETSVNMKNLFWDEGGIFRFNIVSFGITFNVGKNGQATLGANAPYTTNYWGYHLGSVMADFNYNLK